MKRSLFIALTLATACLPSFGRTPASQDKVLEKVGFTQNLNEQLPLDLAFRDDQGRSVKLSDYFGDKPVLLNFVYFGCPMLCTEVLNGTVRALRALSLTAGKDFKMVTISIDPREGPTLAAAKKRLYLERYKRKGSDWAFLTGTEPAIKAATNAAGFHFAYDPEIQEFAHASGVIILTPEGRIARYYFGVEYPQRELRLSLIEASRGKIGTPVDRLLLYCYHYDPETGRYGVLIMRVIRVASLCTLALLATFVFVMIRRERRVA